MRIVALALALSVVACGGPPAPRAVLEGRALAGPVCPVESNPPRPECAPRPVAGATIRVVGADGKESSVVTDQDGTFRIEVAAGAVTVLPQQVEGLMGTPAQFDVVAAEGDVTDLGDIMYDTGIR